MISGLEQEYSERKENLEAELNNKLDSLNKHCADLTAKENELRKK